MTHLRNAMAVAVLICLGAATDGCHRASLVAVEVALTDGYDGAGITQLVATFTLSGQDDAVETFPLQPAGPVAFPASFAVSLPGDLEGVVTVAVSAIDDSGAEHAVGMADVTIERHRATSVTVVIAPYCGNGFIEGGFGEACDDGAANSDTTPDACRTACSVFSCGDGVTDTGEACDDGIKNSNAISDACRTSCSAASCGDTVIDTGEECDNGALNDDLAPDACRTTCADPSCGDSVTDTGESCDDGPLNSDTVPDACRTNCALPTCGDAVVDMGEACDDGTANSATAPDACRLTCVLPFCSDGVTDPSLGETCDDGNTADGDQCGHACDAPPPLAAIVDLAAAPPPLRLDLPAPGPVIATGDLDGDGLADLAFGDAAAGIVRVVLGVDLPATSPATLDVALAAMVTITGAPGSGLGASLAAGDFDGDGLDDLLAGAPGTASAHLVLGATVVAATLPLAIDLASAPADVTVTFPAGDSGGASVAIGDLNDDGFDDLVIGEPGHTPAAGRAGAGRVHVVVGRLFMTFPASVDADLAAELQLDGDDAGDALGSALAAGDFDGDGLDDFAAGAPGGDGAAEAYSGAGEVILIRGRPLTAGAVTLVLDADLGEIEVVLQGGADPGAALGASVALGDLDGDGRAELLAGAALFDAALAGDGAGVIAGVIGIPVALGAAVARDQAAAGADVTLFVTGAVATAALGAALATGDANNDGNADLLIGEPGSSAAFAGGGRVHLWLGRALGTPPVAVDLAATPAEVVVLPELATSALGGAVAFGDVDDDGFADLVFAADGPAAGVVYVLRGGVNPTP